VQVQLATYLELIIVPLAESEFHAILLFAMNGRSLHCALAMSRDKNANDQLTVAASMPAEAPPSSEQSEGGPLGKAVCGGDTGRSSA
jgi:hypothetical protein